MQPGVQIIEFQGNLNLLSGKKLLEAVSQCVSSGPTVLLIDLEQVSFVDSAGLAALVRSYKLVRVVGIRFALCCIHPQVKLLLDTTSISDIFEIFSDRRSFYTSWLQQFPKDALVTSLDDLPLVKIEAG